jgi:glutathione S-transferase
MNEAVLYQYPGGDGLPSLSPPCSKVALALGYLGIPHRLQDLKTPQDAKRLGCTGRVPVLELAGVRPVDSVRILDVLESSSVRRRDQAPSDPAARAQDRVWEHFSNEALYWPVVYLRWLVPEHLRLTTAAMFPKGGLIRVLTRIFGARESRKRALGQGIGGKPADEVFADLERGLAIARDGLAGGDYLGARDAPGRGDLGLAATVAQLGWRGGMPQADAVLDAFPELRAHAARVFTACELSAPAWLEA